LLWIQGARRISYSDEKFLSFRRVIAFYKHAILASHRVDLDYTYKFSKNFFKSDSVIVPQTGPNISDNEINQCLLEFVARTKQPYVPLETENLTVIHYTYN